MATAVWPSTIPQCPILNAFSEERQRNLAAFAPEVGPQRMGRRSTAVGIMTSVSFRMTLFQVRLFNIFYETTIADGSLPFTWPHPITGATYVWKFDDGGAPKFDRMTPNTYRVSFNLMRMPR
jgi:hypothetical protein